MAGPELNDNHLFTYGTLRRAAPMHSLIAADVRFLGPARYRARLVDLGDFPGVVAAVSPQDVVVGEVFLLPAEVVVDVLARLDRYEGEAFVRRQVPVAGEDDREFVAWVYHYRGDLSRSRVVASGDWLEDASRRVSGATRGAPPD